MIKRMRYFVCFLIFFSTLKASPPKVIIFDYGGVIAKVDRRPILRFLSESLNISYKKVKKNFACEKLYKALNQPPSFWEHYAHKPLTKCWFRTLDEYKNELVKPIAGMHSLLMQIKLQKIQVALLSNTNKYRARFIESKGGYNEFHPVLLSCYLGVRKPNPEIYKKLLQHLHCDANECFFIDNQWKNIKAAKKLGIDGEVFKSVDQITAVLEKQGVVINHTANISFVFPKTPSSLLCHN